jgi:hypothetical protein
MVYKKWKEIEDLRKQNQFTSTNIKMNIHKGGTNDELYFNIVHEETSMK